MKKLLLIFLVFPFCLSAQKGFYETLEANGADAEYQEYYSVYKDDKGNQMRGGKRYVCKFAVEKTSDGLPVGFNLVKKQDDGSWKPDEVMTVHERNAYEGAVGYPNVRLVRDERRVFVAVDDYVFVAKVSSQDWTTVKSVSGVYIRTNTTSGAAPKKGEKKKLTFKEKMALAKQKLQEANSDPNAAKRIDEDYEKMVSDYLLAMKKKADNYTPTAKEKADARRLSEIEKEYDAYIKHHNDSIRATPEWQKAEAHRQWVKGNVNVKVINNSGHSYFVGSSKEAFSVYEIPAGSYRVMTCTVSLYYYPSTQKGSPGTVFHTPKAACGSSVTLN